MSIVFQLKHCKRLNHNEVVTELIIEKKGKRQVKQKWATKSHKKTPL